jgi:hypothetical protein
VENSGTYVLASPSYNITSVTDNSTGNCTVTIATNFSSTDYAIAGSAIAAGASDQQQYCMSPRLQAAGSFVAMVTVIDATPNLAEQGFHFCCFGDQA